MLATFARGVAPGWCVVAPSGRRLPVRRLTWQLLYLLVFVALSICGSASFAANSPLADAAEKSARVAILARHVLVDRWQQFERQFLTP